jgi:hypothetical protein
MPRRRTSFCENAIELVRALSIPQRPLYTTEVDYQGAPTRISRKTVQNILTQRGEPNVGTKLVLVRVLEALHPALRDRMLVPELERADFDVKKFLNNSVELPVEERLAVDPLITRLRHIVDSSMNRVDLVNGILRIPIEDAKLQFWEGIGGVLGRLGIGDRDFNEALRRAGMPPEVPILVPGRTLLDCAKRILADPKILPREQQLVWKVATAVYPPFVRKSIPEVKRAARYLAKFWDRSILFTQERWKFSIAPDLADRRPQEKTQVYLLSWLELPLVTQTDNSGPGKTGLFALGRYFQTKAD